MEIKVASAGANVFAGILVVKEAVERSLDAPAFVRGESRTVAGRVVQ